MTAVVDADLPYQIWYHGIGALTIAISGSESVPHVYFHVYLAGCVETLNTSKTQRILTLIQTPRYRARSYQSLEHMLR